MSENFWRNGDTITIERGPEGWRANLLRGPHPDGSEGGMVGDRMIYRYKTPEEAVAKIREAISS